MRAAILSEPGTGGTTFVGLLYATLVRLAAEPEPPVRVSAGPAGLAVLRRLYRELMDGRFPPPCAPLEAARTQIDLEFGGRPAGRGLLGFGAHASTSPRTALRWARVEFGTLARYLAGGTATGAGELPDLTPLDTPIVVVDAGDAGPTSPTPSPDGGARTSDDRVAEVFRELAELRRVARPPAKLPMRPLVVFSRLDRAPAALARRVGLPEPLDEAALERDRPAIATALLRELLPRTTDSLRRGGAPIDADASFLSLVDTGPEVGPGEPRIRTRPIGGERWAPSYPYGEYRRLIDRLGEIARRGDR